MTWVHHDGGRMAAGLTGEAGDNESTVTTTMQNSSGLDRMAEHFYGYGRWEAPFWFIGPEAGMAKNGRDDPKAGCKARRQGRFALINKF